MVIIRDRQQPAKVEGDVIDVTPEARDEE